MFETSTKDFPFHICALLLSGNRYNANAMLYGELIKTDRLLANQIRAAGEDFKKNFKVEPNIPPEFKPDLTSAVEKNLLPEVINFIKSSGNEFSLAAPIHVYWSAALSVQYAKTLTQCLESFLGNAPHIMERVVLERTNTHIMRMPKEEYASTSAGLEVFAKKCFDEFDSLRVLEFQKTLDALLDNYSPKSGSEAKLLKDINALIDRLVSFVRHEVT